MHARLYLNRVFSFSPISNMSTKPIKPICTLSSIWMIEYEFGLLRFFKIILLRRLLPQYQKLMTSF